MPSTATDSITMKGRSGATYEFELYEWGVSFNPVPAVYSVLRDDGQQYTVLYIGHTGDLKERFGDHHKQTCFDRNRKTHIVVRQESSERNRLAIEADLVASYKPPCNELLK